MTHTLVVILVSAITGFIGYFLWPIFWYLASKPDPKLVIIDKPPEEKKPDTRMGDFEECRHCLSCDNYDGKYNSEICKKCGGDKFDLVIGQWENKYVYSYISGYLQRYKFHPKADTQ